jgi:hypothetical protein
VSTAARRKQQLRERSEYYLRLAAMEDQRRRNPGATTRPAFPRGGLFWRLVFVPLYRRVPWHVKARAMRALRMTASDWPEGRRQFGEPWRPPAGAAGQAADPTREEAGQAG